ncbi:MAG: hypothetical protein WAU68_04270 [Vitreimonas sp.]
MGDAVTTFLSAMQVLIGLFALVIGWLSYIRDRARERALADAELGAMRQKIRFVGLAGYL